MLSSFFSCLLCSNKIEEIVYYPKENKKRSKKDKKNKKEEDKNDKIILMKSTRDKKTGLLDGFLEIYNKDGSLKEKVLYIQGKTQYERYKFDSENGVHIIYFPNSDKIHAKYTKNSENKLDGEYILYNINGKIIEKRNYKNGISIDTHFYYNVYDGDDLSNEPCENDSKPKKKTYVIQYDDNGKVISTKFM